MYYVITSTDDNIVVNPPNVCQVCTLNTTVYPKNLKVDGVHCYPIPLLLSHPLRTLL